MENISRREEYPHIHVFFVFRFPSRKIHTCDPNANPCEPRKKIPKKVWNSLYVYLPYGKTKVEIQEHINIYMIKLFDDDNGKIKGYFVNKTKENQSSIKKRKRRTVVEDTEDEVIDMILDDMERFQKQKMKEKIIEVLEKI